MVLFDKDASPEDKNSFLVDLGMGLLAAGGPRPTPISFGQSLASAYQGAVQNQALREDATLRRFKMQQMKEAMAAQKAMKEQMATMPEDVQQAYLLGGPEKAYEAMQQSRFAKQIEGLLGGGQPKAGPPPGILSPRAFDPEMKPGTAPIQGNFDLSTPEQVAGLQANLAQLEKANPAEYRNVVAALQEQGVIPRQEQPATPDWSKVAQASAMGQLSGIKGASGLMELAKFNKPEWRLQDVGGQLMPYNANASTSPFGPNPISKTDTPELAFSKSKDVRDQISQSADKINSRTSELRREFGNLQPVKDMDAINPVLQTAREAAKFDNKASDLNLIYALAKLYDPGSVVRESETEMQMQSGSPAEYLRGYWNSVAKEGGRLTPELRRQMLEQIELRATAYQDAYKGVADQYTELATRGGMDPQMVIRKYRMESKGEAGTGNPIPLPKPAKQLKASDLTKGQVYETPNGPAVWDGFKFKKVAK